jgi:hypothetical protein
VNVLAEKTDDQPPATAEIDAGLEMLQAPQPRAVEVPLLATAVVASLFGLLGFGVPAFIVGVVAGGFMLVRRDRQRTLLLLAAVIALVGTVCGVLASLYWWMQITPRELIGK